MKKILTLAVAGMLFTGAAFACEGKACCKKETKKECKKACKKGEKKEVKTSTAKA